MASEHPTSFIGKKTTEGENYPINLGGGRNC